MLTLHFSHRYETLARLLFERMAARDRAHPFVADTVIVPSAAVRRDLTLALARAHGVCANVEFPYLARWLWQAIARVVPGVATESPFDPALLVWHIHDALTDDAWAAAHPRLQRYLAHADPAMRHDLAGQLAGLFDQYVTFRPDWLAAWSRGGLAGVGTPASATAQDEAWQAELWRRIAPRNETPEAPAADFVAALLERGADLVARGVLQAELHVFALPTMAPLHLHLLQALGACCEVHVYALNPCREYWFEIVEPRRLAYLAARGETGHHEVGNRLLGAWGRQAQASLALLVDACGEAGVEDARFGDEDKSDPGGGGTTLLARLQRAILEMRDLAPASVEIAGDDRSIEVHACHSLARELDVLQDRLLGLFAGDDPPAPHEILVVTPDLEAAAPLIDALFGTAPPARRIPYQISGRKPTGLHGPARAFVDLLALVGSRCTASAVFGLLQQPVVAARFGLDADALERVRGWLLEAGVHWALDDAHCASLGLPAGGGHSFDAGLARLLLGYALPASATEPFAGTLAGGAAEGASDTAALGALWRYVDALATLRRDIAQAPLPPAAWTARLARAVADFVAPADAEIEAIQDVRAALQALADAWQASGCNAALPLDIVRGAVTAALDDPARGGVPTGGVTFASMASLRGLPYRVVCAVGLNDGAFPTAAGPAEFDLMAAPGQARAGDRQRRADERNLFLDLLLAARQTLHLSHVGRSVRDNAPLPPSVLISEVLEAVVPAVVGATPSRFVVEHPLQAFAIEAFRSDADVRKRSFNAEYAQALRERAAAPVALVDQGIDLVEADERDESEHVAEPARPFFAVPLAAPDDAWLDVSIDQLTDFFGHPARYLLRRRLGVHLARTDVELADDEPFVTDRRASSALAARLLPALLGGADVAQARRLALAGTELPAGAFGAQALEAELGALARFAETLRPRLAEPLLPPLAVALDIDAAGRRWHLHGTLANLRASGLLGYRFDELRARDALGSWMPHLLLCAAAPHGAALRSTWLGRSEAFELCRCDDARAQLAQLLALYAQGLVEPLAFHPRAAWAYASGSWKASAAKGAWNGSPFTKGGERHDPFSRLALRGRPDPFGDPVSPEFERCARSVFEPLLQCMEDA
jgi:exodeoxyribonuclease V gamma subunit